jgi:hypothetical protein
MVLIISPPSSSSAGATTYVQVVMLPATISGTTVTIVGAGSTTITATKQHLTHYGDLISTHFDSKCDFNKKTVKLNLILPISIKMGYEYKQFIN